MAHETFADTLAAMAAAPWQGRCPVCATHVSCDELPSEPPTCIYGHGLIRPEVWAASAPLMTMPGSLWATFDPHGQLLDWGPKPTEPR